MCTGLQSVYLGSTSGVWPEITLNGVSLLERTAKEGIMHRGRSESYKGRRGSARLRGQTVLGRRRGEQGACWSAQRDVGNIANE
jgi:hypothetical protein